MKIKKLNYKISFLYLLVFLSLISVATSDETMEIAGFTYDLKDGDLLFRKGASKLVTTIPGPIDHVGIYNGSSGVIESVLTPGVREAPIKSADILYDNKDNFRGIGRVVSANISQREDAVSFARSEVNILYGVPLDFRTWDDGNETRYCSELVYEAYLSQGIEIDEGVIPFSFGDIFWVTPTEIYRSNETTILTPTFEYPDTVQGFVFQSENFTAQINVTNVDQKKLQIMLDWKSNLNGLDLIVKDPNGQIFDKNTDNENFSFEGYFPEKMTFTNPIDGTWTIYVNGDNIIVPSDPLYETQYATFDLTAEIIPLAPDESEGPAPGGINFTNAELSYISTCNPENGLEVVLKGTEANVSAGDTIINITNTTIQSTDAFLTGLIIPNHKMWISMDTRPGPGFNGRVGDVSRIDDNLKRTETGQVLLDADIQLKLDTFGQSQSLLETLIGDWSGPPETVPGFYARVWISPNSLTANGTDCKIFLTNATLKVESQVDSAWTPGGSAYDSQLNQFRTDLINGLADIAADAEVKVNNNPEYADLRRIYASVALAQWYKQQNRENAVFSELIDSENITGLNVSFDQSYYESQAWQHLYTFYFSGGVYWYTIHGGVEMTDIDANTEGEIDNSTNQNITDALITSFVKEDDTYYYSTLIEAEKPNLEPLALGFSSLNPVPNQNVNLTVAIENNGKLNASNFTIYFYSSFVYPDGEEVIEKIDEYNISRLEVDGINLINVTWTTPAIIGDYNVTALLDYNNKIKESNELDNKITETITVYTDYPTVSVTSPETNSFSCGTTTFTGSATDPQDGTLSDSSLNWTSDLDGYLGDNTSTSVNLSLGVHEVNLKATDSEGFTNTDTISINIVECNDPVPTALSPLSNLTYAEGETIYFFGSAVDEEDGNIPNSSLTWNSSLDGTLGTGSSLSSKSLSVGNHTITLKSVDITDLIGLAQVNITVEEGTPSMIIISPANNQLISHKALTNFNGSANDPQDGDISSLITWTSSIDEAIGTGSPFNVNLTIGIHTITATIIDSHGLKNSTSITATVRPPQYPEASIIFPRHTQQFIHGNNITFNATYSDFEDDTITNSDLIWNSSIDGIFGNGTDLKINLSIGTHTIYFTVTDSDNLVTAAQLNITVNPAAPVPNIIAPQNGDIFAQIDYISFNGTATDYEDGILTGNSLNWTSNKDGFLGNGEYLNLTNLSAGTHLITFTANDSTGLTGTDSINIIVVGISQTLINRLADDSTVKNLTFTTAENKTEYISIPKDANISYSAINVRGYSS